MYAFSVADSGQGRCLAVLEDGDLRLDYRPAGDLPPREDPCPACSGRHRCPLGEDGRPDPEARGGLPRCPTASDWRMAEDFFRAASQPAGQLTLPLEEARAMARAHRERHLEGR
jgi:hypothetical protein